MARKKGLLDDIKEDSYGEPIITEKHAIKAGLALLDAKYDGNSDFDKAMRLLQEKMKIKR